MDESNEIGLDQIQIVTLNTQEVYDTYLDINDFWVYWSDAFTK